MPTAVGTRHVIIAISARVSPASGLTFSAVSASAIDAARMEGGSAFPRFGDAGSSAGFSADVVIPTIQFRELPANCLG